MTTPAPWSMKNSSPMRAAGWISMPVTARVAYEIAIGAAGTPASWRAWATRWARIACTPAQFMRISTVPTPRAAGSRSRAEVTSARISWATRLRVPSPIIATERVGRALTLGREERQRHVALAAVGNDHHYALAGEVWTGGDLKRRVDGGPRRDAHQKPFALRGLARPD